MEGTAVLHAFLYGVLIPAFSSTRHYSSCPHSALKLIPSNFCHPPPAEHSVVAFSHTTRVQWGFALDFRWRRAGVHHPVSPSLLYIPGRRVSGLIASLRKLIAGKKRMEIRLGKSGLFPSCDHRLLSPVHAVRLHTLDNNRRLSASLLMLCTD